LIINIITQVQHSLTGLTRTGHGGNPQRHRAPKDED